MCNKFFQFFSEPTIINSATVSTPSLIQKPALSVWWPVAESLTGRLLKMRKYFIFAEAAKFKLC